MIYVFMADGTEEVEAVATIDMLRRAELDVMTLGIGSQMVVGSHGIGLVCDADIKNIQPDENVQAVVIPGGMPGTLNIEKNVQAQAFIDYADEHSKLICAICAAPSVLGHKGLLKGKKATCFPGFEKELEGAILSEDGVVADGNIITAKGAGVAIEFGLKIAERFAGKDEAEKIYKSIQK
ncbi:MAG: DJ-1/PfpI family protein [Clostridia bacterium]|nr:DJ-1/PfpI family protein [Clostridia bacterium]